MSYYDILKISPFSTSSDIKKSYNKLIKKKLTSLEKEEIMKAYTILNDYHSRTIYDKQIQNNEDNLNVVEKEDQIKAYSLEKQYKDDDPDIGNDDNHLLLDILKRLENIEKKLNENYTNYYKEVITINNNIKKNGNKISSVKTEINNNGKKKIHKKLVIYDKNGSITNTFYGNNIKPVKK